MLKLWIIKDAEAHRVEKIKYLLLNSSLKDSEKEELEKKLGAGPFEVLYIARLNRKVVNNPEYGIIRGETLAKLNLKKFIQLEEKIVA